VTLHRFFVPAEAVDRDEVRFPPDLGRQIRTVLRLRPDEQVVVLDGSGTEMLTRLVEVGTAVRGAVEGRRPNSAEPATRLRLYQGILKGAKLEVVLQKCTEVGVSEFVPLISSRSVPAEPGPSREKRYGAILREAAEQSGRGIMPALLPAERLEVALPGAVGAGPTVFLWEGEETVRLHDLDLPGTGRVSLFVGPEGGFSDEEAESARRAGALIATLGSRILRAETAAIVGSALVLQALGELG
jgi:16S rRNA (uracil1498-N3)-methyltransferase